MERLAEVEHKHQKIRALLDQYGADTLWIRRTYNISWITAGAEPAIDVSLLFGSYSVLITREKRLIFTTNIEYTRLRAEEDLEALGFEFEVYPWYEDGQPNLPNLITDDDSVDGTLQTFRWILLPSEQERMRALGQDISDALEETARSVRVGDREVDLEARLQANCAKRRAFATVTLIGSDDRISAHRHPFATTKPIEHYAMVVVCARRGGLVVAGTRLAHIGNAPQELIDKVRLISEIDVAIMANTKPGRVAAEVFDDIKMIYDQYGQSDQWKYHHQGGLIAYHARETIVTAADTTVFEPGMAVAWNPSIVGCKSEDTFLLHSDGTEIVTEPSADFPVVEIETASGTVRKAGILIL